MAKQYVFTQDIAGSNNGYEVENYNKNQVIEQGDLCEELFNAWLKAGVIKDLEVGEDVENFLNDEDGNAPLPEGTEIIDEDEAKDGTEDAGAGEGEQAEGNTPEGEENSAEGQPDTAELTDEKIGDLVYQAKEILEVPEGATLADEDIAKLKEIGVELKIAGMQSSQKPQTILDKINAYIDEYENVGEGEGEGEGEEEIPEA